MDDLAFSVFANGGYRVNPYLVTRVTDHKDKVLVDKQPLLLNETLRAVPQRNAFLDGQPVVTAQRRHGRPRRRRTL